MPLAWALIEKGVSPGVALVFLMTGPATNAATIATIGKVMGKKTAALYLASVALTALAAGVLLDYTFEIGQLTPRPAAMAASTCSRPTISTRSSTCSAGRPRSQRVSNSTLPKCP